VFAAIRRYRGLDGSLVDEMVANGRAICQALTSAPGSRGCDVIRTREGLIVVTLGDDEGSVVESGRRFVTWLDRHVPAVRAITPEVWAGTVLVHGTTNDPGREGARE
jgi:hypothetical protein